jgi:pimeloyl-ACP methyl ester carboxylesterase
MENARHQKIVNMEWEEFNKQLLPSTRSRGASAQADRKALEEYFGEEEFRELELVAAQSRRTRSRAVAALGNIVLLPGIMGSSLALVEGSSADTIWVNLLRIVRGFVGKLRLSADGKTDQNIRVTSVDKRTYTRSLLKLQARWNVKPFAFDWRKDLDVSAHELNAFIKHEFKDQPVHLVAHSMGGLVSRNFIRLHPDTWAGMRGDGVQGGRLIMLGTPNYGSFAIPQVMTGSETLIRWLARLDLSHDRTQVLEIINTFAGSYQMLPSPGKIPLETRALYELASWGDFGSSMSSDYLARAEQFHDQLAKSSTSIDPDRMSYIAGCNRKTLSGLKIIGPGEFQYETTMDGDGRVPFALGLLEGVTTYYVEEDHGSLPKNDNVITAVDQLLETGRTTTLSAQPVIARGVMTTAPRWNHPIAEHYAGADLEQIARRVNDNKATEEEVRAAEIAMTRAVMGEDRPERNLTNMRETKRQAESERDVVRPALKIEVIHGDIKEVKAPIVVVGQYKGVVPINAIGELDKALGHWISQANKRAMIGAELGQLFFIPVKKGQIGADAVLLAGMGEEGRFTNDDLRYLVSNATYAISSLDTDSFATVLIGAGAGNLSENHAIRGLLFGICEALHNLRRDLEVKGAELNLKKVKIIEYNKERADRLFEVLNNIKSDDAAVNFEIKVTRQKIKTKKAATPVKSLQLQNSEQQDDNKFYPRITIERSGDLFHFSALTKDAVIPVRDVEIQSFFSEGIAESLINSRTREEQLTLGRLLLHIFPEDFQQLFNSNLPLSLILDSSTAAFPWEMTCFSRTMGPAFFGTHLNLARQFRTLLSSAPSVSLVPNNKLRVLVIADPAPEPQWQLPGARKEGRAVTRVLNQIKQETQLDIEIIDRIGADECDPIQLLALILDGNFDVIHYAGHGFFDEETPSHGGWILGDKVRLTAREIFRLRRAPRLIFANACFSSVVNKEMLTAEQMNRNLAGIAEAFFERGVPNYLGAGWTVQDDLAVEFATTFYYYALTGRILEDEQQRDGVVNEEHSRTASSSKGRDNSLVEPVTLGEAISQARQRILHDGSTWGAYQHYGQPDSRLMKFSPPHQTGKTGSSKKQGATKTKKSGKKKTTSKKSRDVR